MHVLMRRVVLQYLFVVLLDDLLQGFCVSIHQPLVLLLGGQRMDSMDAVKYHTNQRTRWRCIGKTHGSLSAQFCATHKEVSERVPAINNGPHVIQPSGAQHKKINLSRNRCKYCAVLGWKSESTRTQGLTVGCQRVAAVNRRTMHHT